MSNPVFEARIWQVRVSRHVQGVGATFVVAMRDEFADPDGLPRMEQMIDQMGKMIRREIERLCTQFAHNAQRVLELGILKRICEERIAFLKDQILPVVRKFPSNAVARTIALRNLGELYGYQQAVQADLFA